MERQLITFETAKLAKKKFFDWESSGLYDENGDFGINHHDYRKLFKNIEEDTYNTAAPAQSLLQKWLREIHNIHFEIKPIFKDKIIRKYNITIFKNIGKNDTKDTFKFKILEWADSYEDALEVALFKGLKLIIL